MPPPMIAPATGSPAEARVEKAIADAATAIDRSSKGFFNMGVSFA